MCRRPKDTIGGRIKNARINKLLSQKELSEKVHISVAAISQYEVDKRTPSASMLSNLSTALDVSISWILGEKTQYTLDEIQIISMLSTLGEQDKHRVMAFIESLKEGI